MPLGLGNHFRLLGHLNESGIISPPTNLCNYVAENGTDFYVAENGTDFYVGICLPSAKVVSVMGPAGAPMRPPYGLFAGKSSGRQYTQTFTVMGPAGAPMRPPYGPFGGKFGPTKNVVVTIMGPAGAPMMPPRPKYNPALDVLTDNNYVTLQDDSGVDLVAS